jgi:hypothetical protein
LHQSGSIYQAPHGPKGGEGAAGAFYRDQPLIVEGIGHPMRDEAAAAVRELAVVMDRFLVAQDLPHTQPPSETRMPSVMDFYEILVAISM